MSADTKLLAWKPHLGGGALAGWADVKLPNGMKLYGVTVWCSAGRTWASLPARPKLTRDGRVIIKDGLREYEPTCQWPDRATADRFSAVVCDLVSRRDHEAFKSATSAMLKGRRR
jgi:hypothetical protein